MQVQVGLHAPDNVRPVVVDRCPSQGHAAPGLGDDLVAAAAANAAAVVHDWPPKRFHELPGAACVEMPNRTAELVQRGLRSWL